MRVVIQRVGHARIRIQKNEERTIGPGMLILLGIEENDTAKDCDWLCSKISNLRIFDDENGKMNHSLMDVGGDIMVVSQFTLHASTKKGNRPSWIRAAAPDKAEPMYHSFIQTLTQHTGKEIVTGEFGAYMEISLLNDGPVTLFIDTKNKE